MEKNDANKPRHSPFSKKKNIPFEAWRDESKTNILVGERSRIYVERYLDSDTRQ